MSENRVIVKNSLILYFRLFIVSVVGFISVRYLIEMLGVSDYGLYSVVGGMVSLIAFLNSIMITTTYRFFSFEIGLGLDGEMNSLFNVSLVLHFMFALIMVVLASSFGYYYINKYLSIPEGKLSDALFVFKTSVLSSFVVVVGIPYQGLITAKEKFGFLAYIEIAKSLSSLFVILILQNLDVNKLRLYGFSIAMISIFSTIAYYFYTKKKYKDIVRWNFQNNIKKYFEMLAYGVWMLFGAFSAASETYISVIMINIFFGTVVNASFSIASQVNNSVKMFSKSLSSVVVPQITKSYSRGDTLRNVELVKFTSKYSFFLMLIPSIPILVCADNILEQWIVAVPDYAAVFVRLMLINALVVTMSAGLETAVNATGKIRGFQLLVGLLSFFGLGVSYMLFIKGAPPYSIIVVFIMISVFGVFIKPIILSKLMLFDVKKYYGEIYFRCMLVLLPLCCLFFINKSLFNGVYGLMVLIFISIISVLISIYLLGLSSNEKLYIKNYIQLNFLNK